jgi:hypothetical protein
VDARHEERTDPMQPSRAAMTVFRPREEVERLWQSSEYRPEYIEGLDARVTFKEAPGDRGTEIHVDLEKEAPGGRIGEIAQKLTSAEPLAKVKDDLRRFKQHVETGVIPRSEGSPEGELAERKLKQRPAQPLDESELQKVGVR